MNDENMLEALHNISFLQSSTEEHLEQLVEIARFISFPEGKVIFHQGDPAERAFLIVSGTVSLEICAPAVGCSRILTIGAGDLLGWSSVLGRAHLTSTARALTATEAIELSGERLRNLCEQNPRFGYEFMRRTALALTSRLSTTRLQLLNVFAAETPRAVDGIDDLASSRRGGER